MTALDWHPRAQGTEHEALTDSGHVLSALRTQEAAAIVTRTRALVSSTSYTSLDWLTGELAAATGQTPAAVRSALCELVGRGVLIYRQAVGVRYAGTRAERGVG